MAKKTKAATAAKPDPAADHTFGSTTSLRIGDGPVPLNPQGYGEHDDLNAPPPVKPGAEPEIEAPESIGEATEAEAARLDIVARYDLTGERAAQGNEVFCASPGVQAALRRVTLCIVVAGDGAIAVGLSRNAGDDARAQAWRDAVAQLGARRNRKG